MVATQPHPMKGIVLFRGVISAGEHPLFLRGFGYFWHNKYDPNAACTYLLEVHPFSVKQHRTKPLLASIFSCAGSAVPVDPSKDKR